MPAYYLCTDVRVQCAASVIVCTDGVLTPYVPFVPCVLAADGDAKADFWILDSATLKWTEQTRADVKGSWPAMRHSMAFVAVNSDTIIVFGGMSAGEWPLHAWLERDKPHAPS